MRFFECITILCILVTETKSVPNNIHHEGETTKQPLIYKTEMVARTLSDHQGNEINRSLLRSSQFVTAAGLKAGYPHGIIWTMKCASIKLRPSSTGSRCWSTARLFLQDNEDYTVYIHKSEDKLRRCDISVLDTDMENASKNLRKSSVGAPCLYRVASLE